MPVLILIVGNGATNWQTVRKVDYHSKQGIFAHAYLKGLNYTNLKVAHSSCKAPIIFSCTLKCFFRHVTFAYNTEKKVIASLVVTT